MGWFTDFLVSVIPKKTIARAVATPAADRPICLAMTANYTTDSQPLRVDQWLAVETVKALYVEGKLVGQLTPRAKK